MTEKLLAGEAIAAKLASEEWQLDKIQSGIAEQDSGQVVSHAKVSEWLKSWGTPGEPVDPRNTPSQPAKPDEH